MLSRGEFLSQVLKIFPTATPMFPDTFLYNAQVTAGDIKFIIVYNPIQNLSSERRWTIKAYIHTDILHTFTGTTLKEVATQAIEFSKEHMIQTLAALYAFKI